MPENFEKISASEKLPEGSAVPLTYQQRAIDFAQAVLATARAFPTRLTPEIPDKEYAAVVERVKVAAEFLIREGVMAPRFAPEPHA
ncbi:MAG: hypothetical protein Q7R68_10865 [Nitrospirales bacterium]|nr:hypothetical protein [Nitrospirales bacterium]